MLESKQQLHFINPDQISLNRLQDLPAQLDGIQLAAVLPEDLAAGADEDGEGQGTGPLGVDGVAELVDVVAEPASSIPGNPIS